MLVRAPSLGSPGQPSVSTVSQAVEAGLAQGAFIDAHRERFGVEPVGRVLGVSASAYYKHASGERCARAVADERLLGRIRELHAANYYTYGYRRIWKALLRAGETVPRCQVQRLMRTHGIVGAKRRGRPWRTTRPDPHAHRRPDLVQRQFAVEARNRLCVADVSYLLLGRPRLLGVHDRRLQRSRRRLAACLAHAHHDWCSMRCGWRSPSAAQTLTSPSCTTPTAVALHQHRLRPDLADHGVLASVGSVGDAYDNALAESFVDSFKPELIADRVSRTRSQLELAVVAYIGWFNHARLDQVLGDIPPAQMEASTLRGPRPVSLQLKGGSRLTWSP